MDWELGEGRMEGQGPPVSAHVMTVKKVCLSCLGFRFLVVLRGLYYGGGV